MLSGRLFVFSVIFLLTFVAIAENDHNIVVGANYNEKFDGDVRLSAQAQAQSTNGYTQTHAELNGQKSYGKNGEVHGTIGANNNDLYLSAGGIKYNYSDGLNMSHKAEVSVNQNAFNQRLEVGANKSLDNGFLNVLVGEENLKLFASGLIHYFQNIQGYDVNETAWGSWQNNYFSSQLIAETAKQISDLVKVYLRGRLTNLEDIDVLVRAVLSNTTYNDAKVNGYAQAALSQSGLVWEAILYAYELFNNKYDTNAVAGVQGGTPFFNIRTTFKDSGADFQAFLNTSLSKFGLLYDSSAVAAQEVNENVGGRIGLRFQGLDLKLYEQAMFGTVHYNDSIENGKIHANANFDFSSNGIDTDISGGVQKNFSQNMMGTDDFSINQDGQLYNRATLQGYSFVSNFLANYLLEAVSTSAYEDINTVYRAKVDASRDNLRLGVRAFLQNQLRGVGAYAGTEGYYNGYKYRAGISGDINSTKEAEVRVGGQVNTTLSGFESRSFGDFISDLNANDYLTIGTVLTNQIQTLKLTANKNLRGYRPDSLEANYTYALSNGYFLNLKANKTQGRKAYLEGNISRTTGTQSVLVYFSVDENGTVSFNKTA